MDLLCWVYIWDARMFFNIEHSVFTIFTALVLPILSAIVYIIMLATSEQSEVDYEWLPYGILGVKMVLWQLLILLAVRAEHDLTSWYCRRNYIVYTVPGLLILAISLFEIVLSLAFKD